MKSIPLRAAVRAAIFSASALSAATALAQTTPQGAAGDELTEIVVTGRGEARTSAAITTEYIETQVEGIAPLAILKDIPGVNVQTSDPFGLYEHNNRLRIRGFDMSQIGMTIDGVPFVSHAAEGGHVTRFIASENLAGIQVSPGSGDVTQPALSALGGAIRYISKDPADEAGGKASYTIGRYDMTRIFGRLETGLLGDTGIKGYVLGSRANVGQFENVRYANRIDHFETKWMKEFGTGNSLTYAFRWDFGDDHDTQNVTTSFEPNYAASGQLNSLITGQDDQDGFWVGYWRNDHNSRMHSIHGKFELADNLRLEVTPYWAANFSRIFYGVPASTALANYNAAVAGTPGRTDVSLPNGAPAQRNATRDLSRTGLTVGLTWDVGVHTIELGGWYEDGTYDYYQPLNNSSPTDGEIIAYPVIRIDADYSVDTKVLTLYLKDAIRFFDERLKLELGVKGMHIVRSLAGYANPQDFNVSLLRDVEQTHSDWLQPQAGFSFDLTGSTQFFVNYAENFGAIPQAALASLIYNDSLKPESSRNLDVGVRVDGNNWSGYFALFGVEYKDRILALSATTRGVAGSTYLNVNSVQTKGAELTMEYRPTSDWRFSYNLSYVDAQYDGDYYTFDSSNQLTVLVPVDGNQLPDNPELVSTVSATWQGQNFSTSLDSQFMDKRFADTRNTLEVTDYTVFNGSVSYRGDPGSVLEHTRFQVAGYNLTDKKYISSIGPNVATGTLKRGYPRALYFSVSYEF